jgi:hypothetical protein
MTESPGWRRDGGALAYWIAELLDTERWSPNEATAMGYDGSQAGHTADRDHLCYRGVIAICSLKREGRPDIVADCAGEEIIESICCQPSDVVLLRCNPTTRSTPDLTVLGEVPDPLHVVRAPMREQRTPLIFRVECESEPT